MQVTRIDKPKPQKKIREKTLDSEFSYFIRHRDNFTCQRCGKPYPPNSPGLHASHFIGRSHRATRWDPDNVDAACNGCHSFWETHKATVYRDWKQNQLGQERFAALLERGQTVKKWKQHELAEMRERFKVS